jgi:hypothetical protein
MHGIPPAPMADGAIVAHAIPVEVQFVARLAVQSQLLTRNLIVDLMLNLT